ncbi:MAG: hypothetical protein Q9190_007052 [Brigantiaea leucoxantha]
MRSSGLALLAICATDIFSLVLTLEIVHARRLLASRLKPVLEVSSLAQSLSQPQFTGFRNSSSSLATQSAESRHNKQLPGSTRLTDTNVIASEPRDSLTALDNVDPKRSAIAPSRVMRSELQTSADVHGMIPGNDGTVSNSSIPSEAYVRVNIPQIYAADQCGILNRSRHDVTMTFEVNELSTIDGDGATKTLNVGDVKCPHPTYAGQRLLLPNQAILALDPYWRRLGCKVVPMPGYDAGFLARSQVQVQGWDDGQRKISTIPHLTRLHETDSSDRRTAFNNVPSDALDRPEVGAPDWLKSVRPLLLLPVAAMTSVSSYTRPSAIEGISNTASSDVISSSLEPPVWEIAHEQSSVIAIGRHLDNQQTDGLPTLETVSPMVSWHIGSHLLSAMSAKPEGPSPAAKGPQSVPSSSASTGKLQRPESLAAGSFGFSPTADSAIQAQSSAHRFEPTSISNRGFRSATPLEAPMLGNQMLTPVIPPAMTKPPVSTSGSAKVSTAERPTPGEQIPGFRQDSTGSSPTLSLGKSAPRTGSSVATQEPHPIAPSAVTAGHNVDLGNPAVAPSGAKSEVVSGNLGMVTDDNNPLPAEASGMVINDTPVSLSQSKLLIATKTVKFLPSSSGHALPIGTPEFIASPLLFSTAGDSISPDGPELTGTNFPGLTRLSRSSPGKTNAPFAGQQPSPRPFTVAGNVFTPNLQASSIAGTTISPGGPGLAMADTPSSSGLSRLPLGKSVTPIAPSSFVQLHTVAGNTFTPNPSVFPIAGTAVSRNGPPIIVSGTPISLGPSGLVVGKSTLPLELPSPHALTVAGNTFSPDPSALTIGGITPSRGGPPIILSGTPVSLGSVGLAFGSTTLVLPSLLPAESDPVLTGGAPEVLSIAGSTVSKNGPAITIAGTPVSLGPSGLVIGTSTSPFSAFATESVDDDSNRVPEVFSIANTRVSRNGPAITISGTPISLGSSGLVVGSNIIPLPSISDLPSPSLSSNNQPVYDLHGQEITQGGLPITVSGTLFSLGSEALVIGSSTLLLPSAPNESSPVPTTGATPAVYGFDGHTITQGGEPITVSGTRISLGSEALVVGTSSFELPESDQVRGTGTKTDTSDGGWTAGFPTSVKSAEKGDPSGTGSAGGSAPTDGGKKNDDDDDSGVIGKRSGVGAKYAALVFLICWFIGFWAI